MLILVTMVHVLVCVFMIFVILLQPGKDAGMGSALGGGAATSAFGGRGAVTFLSKLTAACAGLYFLTSLGLSFVGLKTSVAAGEVTVPITAPATTGATAPAQGTAPAAPMPAPAATPAAPTGKAAAPATPAEAPAKKK